MSEANRDRTLHRLTPVLRPARSLSYIYLVQGECALNQQYRRRVRRGDVYSANLSPYIGSEQGGIRPVVILQNNVGNWYSPTVIVAPLTSRMYKSHLPTHVTVQGPALSQNPSMVLLEQIRTIDKTRLLQYLGVVPPNEMEKVNRAVTVSLGLAPGYEMEAGSMKRAWIYTRIDAPEDAHGILKGQHKDLYDYAEQMGMEVVGSSSDLGSGVTPKRPGQNQVIEAAKQGRFNILLVKSISRLSRNMSETLILMDTLRELNIEIYSPLEGRLDQNPAVGFSGMGPNIQIV